MCITNKRKAFNEMKIRQNVNLAKMTTFKTGGPARFFVEVKSLADIKKAVGFAKSKKLKIFILGGGSNLLISDKGVGGLVIKILIRGVTFKGLKVYAGAGELWDKVVSRAVSKKLSGIENLSLIPGTVGGAVYQNIGAYGVELKDFLEYVDVFDVRLGHIKRLSNKNCRFGYRSSIFQKRDGNNCIILGASLRLSKKFNPNLNYPDLKTFKGKFSLNEVRKMIIKIRKLKLVYPSVSVGSAGSFFKNPTITIIRHRQLITDHPDLSGREIGGGLVKLSAGQLIERSGWKGVKVGRVGVAKKHALVLVSYRGAKTEELIKLSQKIKNSVFKKFGLGLEEEVVVMV